MDQLSHEWHEAGRGEQNNLHSRARLGQPPQLHGKAGATAGSSSEVDTWTIAALAHGSILLTLVLSFAGGAGALLGLLVPFVILLTYRERSRFVAYHAMQALVYQVAGALAYILLAIPLALAAATAWAISGVLSLVVIGLLLMPGALFVTMVMVVVLVAIPLLWLAYGLYAAYQVYQGTPFQYWLLGEWVHRQMRV